MKRFSLILLAGFVFTGFACSFFTPASPPTSPEATQEVVVSEPTTTPLPTETSLP